MAARLGAAARAAAKAEVVELRGQAYTIRECASMVGVSRRTVQEWRQKDEKFAVALAEAEKDVRDFWVEKARVYALDDKKPLQGQMIMFMLKKEDPSYRDNHKVEHIVSGGLQSALKRLAKMGSE